MAGRRSASPGRSRHRSVHVHHVEVSQLTGYLWPVGNEGRQPPFSERDPRNFDRGKYLDVMPPFGEAGCEPANAGRDPGDDRRSLGGHDQHVERAMGGRVQGGGLAGLQADWPWAAKRLGHLFQPFVRALVSKVRT